MPKKASIALLLFILLSGLVGYGALRSQEKTLVHQTLDPISLNELNDDGFIDVITSDSFYLVHLFATWASLTEMELQTMHQISKRGIKVIGVAIKDTPYLVTKLLQEKGNPYQSVGVSQTGQEAVALGMTSPPETLVMSGNKVLHRFKGPVLARDVTEVILPLQKKNSGKTAS